MHGDNRPPITTGPGPIGMPRRRVLAGLAALAATGVVAPARPTLAAERFAPLPSELQPPSALAADLTSFSRIRGVPIYYWRDGTRDTRLRQWYAAPSMVTQVDRWMNDLLNLSRSSGWPPVAYLVSAGFYVNRSGQHGQGTAMDLDAVVWADGRRCVPLDHHHRHPWPGVRRRYLAVEASLRRRFRWVLDAHYNAAHLDHFHADLGGLPSARLRHDARSDTVFVQAVCNEFMDSGLAVDGIWGPLTEAQFERLKRRLRTPGNMQDDPRAVRPLLNRITRHGLRNTAI